MWKRHPKSCQTWRQNLPKKNCLNIDSILYCCHLFLQAFFVLYALVKQVLFACYRSNNGQSSRDFWATIFPHKTVSSKENRWTPFQFVKKVDNTETFRIVRYFESDFEHSSRDFYITILPSQNGVDWRKTMNAFSISHKNENIMRYFFLPKKQKRQTEGNGDNCPQKWDLGSNCFSLSMSSKYMELAGSMKSWPTMAAGVIGATCLTATTSNTSEWQRQVFASREKTQVQCQLTFFAIFLVHIKQFVLARVTFILWLNKELLKTERTHFQVVLKKTYM